MLSLAGSKWAKKCSQRLSFINAISLPNEINDISSDEDQVTSTITAATVDHHLVDEADDIEDDEEFAEEDIFVQDPADEDEDDDQDKRCGQGHWRGVSSSQAPPAEFSTPTSREDDPCKDETCRKGQIGPVSSRGRKSSNSVALKGHQASKSSVVYRNGNEQGSLRSAHDFARTRAQDENNQRLYLYI